MTDRINKIKARLKAATPGPWDNYGTDVEGPNRKHIADFDEWDDMLFTIHARQDISLLLRALELAADELWNGADEYWIELVTGKTPFRENAEAIKEMFKAAWLDGKTLDEQV